MPCYSSNVFRRSHLQSEKNRHNGRGLIRSVSRTNGGTRESGIGTGHSVFDSLFEAVARLAASPALTTALIPSVCVRARAGRPFRREWGVLRRGCVAVAQGRVPCCTRDLQGVGDPRALLYLDSSCRSRRSIATNGGCGGCWWKGLALPPYLRPEAPVGPLLGRRR